ncbi:MAG: hypothetical protein ABSH34_16715 [Verrucomicrobiota bacterium]
MRHLFATRGIESGEDVPTVSRWLGHGDGGALAMKVHGHVRDQRQTILVAHQAAGMHLPPGLLAPFGQRHYEVLAIHAIQGNVLAPISSAHHVIHGTGIFNPWFARHGLFFAFLASKANTKTNHTTV